ncbi:SDR family NAD(P)-dependent oxidoreductase [Streptomyces gobiensis]|uniref:SDR family NAD(P)-dependent oxidoreductase n=1 Tax=Streptomyces gobiensis TaxID=2875706 RepID=UPI001E5A1D6B|nr:SDR family NAD(P)-dependent oxidoreductase [Streptomyces gobiensis]UGY93229.1 SDR family NAD(P)-dependent oxidoreductase [Streptomyces gobiensis]
MGETARRLSGTVALVTGATSGIGEATALALAAEGAAVAVVGRRRDRLDRLADRIQRDGGDATLVRQADITDEDQARDAVEQTVSELGRLDTVVNNAGLMLLGPAEEAKLDEWQRMVEVNLLGLMYTSHAAIPHLLRAATDGDRRVADLVNVGSTLGRRTKSGRAVYSATKFGVGAFSEGLRQELTARHVRVSVIEPGSTVTELRTHNRPEIQRELDAKAIERLEARDIAESIGFIVTRPRHVSICELMIRPTDQL